MFGYPVLQLFGHFANWKTGQPTNWPTASSHIAAEVGARENHHVEIGAAALVGARVENAVPRRVGVGDPEFAVIVLGKDAPALRASVLASAGNVHHRRAPVGRLIRPTVLGEVDPQFGVDLRHVHTEVAVGRAARRRAPGALVVAARHKIGRVVERVARRGEDREDAVAEVEARIDLAVLGQSPGAVLTDGCARREINMVRVHSVDDPLMRLHVLGVPEGDGHAGFEDRGERRVHHPAVSARLAVISRCAAPRDLADGQHAFPGQARAAHRRVTGIVVILGVAEDVAPVGKANEVALIGVGGDRTIRNMELSDRDVADPSVLRRHEGAVAVDRGYDQPKRGGQISGNNWRRPCKCLNIKANRDSSIHVRPCFVHARP